MSGRTALILAASLAIGPPVATFGQATPPGVTIRWEVDPSGTTSAVSVLGLKPEVLKSFREPGWSDDRWSGLLAITVDLGRPGQPGRPAMLGSYRVEGEALRFTPRYPFGAGRPYIATFRPANLPGGNGPDVTSRHVILKPKRAVTVVTRVSPSTDRVPENLLKFYLHFSAPMSRGEVYDRVRLLREDGTPVDLPFLRLGEELWDPTGTRLTLLIDPGRIKRGLKPREEHGPVLEAGRVYTLVIDPGWPDAEGDPLGKEVRKTLRAGAPDEIQPDPKTWTIARPDASTRDPLTLTFPEPLDRALLESALTMIDAKGEAVPGRIEVDADETRWRFTPEVPWVAGDYELEVETELEDLAGNSIRRPFEVDVQRDTPIRPEAKVIRLPIQVRAKGR